MADEPKFKAKSFQLSSGNSQVTPQSIGAVVGLLVFGGLMAFYFLGGWDWWTARKVDDLYEQTAEDLETQYYLMGGESSDTEKCVKAGTVAAAWLQAKNQPNYQTWKQVEKRHCKDAGIEK